MYNSNFIWLYQGRLNLVKTIPDIQVTFCKVGSVLCMLNEYFTLGREKNLLYVKNEKNVGY